MAKLVSVRSYPTRLEAEWARSQLEAHGIDAMVLTDDSGGLRPYLVVTTGAWIAVREEDVERARRILEAE